MDSQPNGEPKHHGGVLKFLFLFLVIIILICCIAIALQYIVHFLMLVVFYALIAIAVILGIIVLISGGFGKAWGHIYKFFGGK
jgi:hypothetical protein